MPLIPESVVVPTVHAVLFVYMFVFFIHCMLLVASNIEIVPGISMGINFNLTNIFI